MPLHLATLPPSVRRAIPCGRAGSGKQRCGEGQTHTPFTTAQAPGAEPAVGRVRSKAPSCRRASAAVGASPDPCGPWKRNISYPPGPESLSNPCPSDASAVSGPGPTSALLELCRRFRSLSQEREISPPMGARMTRTLPCCEEQAGRPVGRAILVPVGAPASLCPLERRHPLVHSRALSAWPTYEEVWSLPPSFPPGPLPFSPSLSFFKFFSFTPPLPSYLYRLRTLNPKPY